VAENLNGKDTDKDWSRGAGPTDAPAQTLRLCTAAPPVGRCWSRPAGINPAGAPAGIKPAARQVARCGRQPV